MTLIQGTRRYIQYFLSIHPPARTLVLDSPQYPDRYPNDQMCTWTITATHGQLSMVFSKFALQSDSTCSKDYLQISGPIKRYRRARLCGFPVTTFT